MEDKKEFHLEDRGMIFLCGQVTRDSVTELSRKIIQINLEGKNDFIQLMISSPGGDVDAGFALIDLMEWSKLPVYTTGFGLVASMGLAILMAGEKGHRVITPRASLMSHRFAAMSMDNYSGLVARRRMEDRTHQLIVDHYAACTAIKDSKKIEAELLRDVDTWITPDEALAYGIVDRVNQGKARN